MPSFAAMSEATKMTLSEAHVDIFEASLLTRNASQSMIQENISLKAKVDELKDISFLAQRDYQIHHLKRTIERLTVGK